MFLEILSLFIFYTTCQSAPPRQNCMAYNQQPQNQSVYVNDTNVVMHCQPETFQVDWIHVINERNVIINVTTFGVSTITAQEKLNELFTETGIKLNESTYMITFPTISVRHHGGYYCRIPQGCHSSTGYLNVHGSVEMDFYVQHMRQIELLKELPVYRAGQDVKADIIIFGYPEPTLSIEKRQVDGTYQQINDNRFTLSSTHLMIQPIQLEDNGEYRIWGNNTYGNTPFDFNITVTGVAPPFISLSENQLTTITYQQPISINCTIQERAFEESLMLYWRYANSSVIPSVGSLRQQRIANDTTATLIIDSFTEDHNGNYNCFARNSNTEMEANVKIIGPPTKMSIPEVEVISGGPQTIIEWIPPLSFDAKITNYSIKRRYFSNDSVYPVETIQVPSSSQNRYILNDFCPGGLWEFSIAAINEFNNIGEYSAFGSRINVNGNCPPISSSIIPTTSLKSSITMQYSTTDSHNPPFITKTSSYYDVTHIPSSSDIQISSKSSELNSIAATSLPVSAADHAITIGVTTGMIALLMFLCVIIVVISSFFVAKQWQKKFRDSTKTSPKNFSLPGVVQNQLSIQISADTNEYIGINDIIHQS